MNHRITAPHEPRPPTVAERDLLRWLLTHGAKATGTDALLAAAFLPQVDALQVVGRCDCGCPSLELALVAPELALPGVSTTIADVEGLSPEGSEIGVILRAASGSLKELELYARDGRIPFSIPGAQELKSFW
jgi:hypothetical protein